MSEELQRHVLLDAVLATTSYVEWDPQQTAGDGNVRNKDITQLMIRQCATNYIHREELDSLSQLRDQYLEELTRILRVREHDDSISPLFMPNPAIVELPEPTNTNGSNENGDKKSNGKRSVDTKQISQVKKELTRAYEKDALEQAKRRKKRKGYSKEVSEILNNWYNDHLQSPYPNEDEKRELCTMCGLTLLQLNNWFSNKRIRMKKKGGGGRASASSAASDGHANDHHGTPGIDMPLYASFSGPQDYVFAHPPMGRHPHEYAHMHGHEDLSDYFK